MCNAKFLVLVQTVWDWVGRGHHLEDPMFLLNIQIAQVERFWKTPRLDC